MLKKILNCVVLSLTLSGVKRLSLGTLMSVQSRVPEDMIRNYIKVIPTVLVVPSSS